jgi:hypothetical protein
VKFIAALIRDEAGVPLAVGVMNHPSGYEAVLKRGGRVQNLDAASPELVAQVKQWIAQIQRGELTDPTETVASPLWRSGVR